MGQESARSRHRGLSSNPHTGREENRREEERVRGAEGEKSIVALVDRAWTTMQLITKTNAKSNKGIEREGEPRACERERANG